MSPYFFIFGFGYTAKALAPKLMSQGLGIVGTSRSTKGHIKTAASIFKQAGINKEDIR